MAAKIALSGRSGCGKTTIAEYLVDKHAFARCSTGLACRELCRKLFASESKSILNMVTDALKAIDPDVWLRAALSTLDGDRPVVFDSMRFAGDYAFLKEQGFQMWRVEAPLEVRVRRMKDRGQIFIPDDDNHPAETELDSYQFDRVIENPNDDIHLLHDQIERALQ